MNKVYIVFGDEPRSDGDNVLGVFKTWLSAMNFVREYAYIYYSIEEYEVME